MQIFETQSTMQLLLVEQRRTNQLLEWVGQMLAKQGSPATPTA